MPLAAQEAFLGLWWVPGSGPARVQKMSPGKERRLLVVQEVAGMPCGPPGGLNFDLLLYY